MKATTAIASILLVDDMPDNLRLLSWILESQGYRIRKTTSGKLALQAAQRERPDLILLDVNMPEMNGYQVCQGLKASPITCDIPVIFISALDQLDNKMLAFELGGLDYITKPFQEQEVLARVRTQLLIQQQRQQLIAQNRQLEQEIQERQRVEAEVRQLNASLEQNIYSRTLELHQALTFESTLKRISDQVRDSLDSHQILQTAVEKLAKALNVYCCDAALYDPNRLTSTIRYEWVQPDQPVAKGQTLYMADGPEIYQQLQQGACLAFCQIQPSSIRAHAAILVCPIFDDQVQQQGILGDLWLFKPIFHQFDELEIRLVQQVANQCAIALRQAQLYEAAQTQVKELQRLNQLKDDFLCTISHELRTPISNIKLTLQLLSGLADQGANFIDSSSKDTQARRYLRVLQEECDRELYLIQDLLDFQHLEAGTYKLQSIAIQLQDWIPHLLEPFEIRAETHQQTLSLNLAADLPPLTTDLFSLSRIVTELVNNACKYTPIGETITIAAQAADEMLYLKVSSTGVEIPAVEQSRIFDKFYRIPNSDPWKYGGTGLGLALVKKMVEQIGGTIAVASDNCHTCFTVNLPLLS